MGVHSFWDIVGPTARPVKLESLQDKKMAVDASIWIYQFIKAMRDSDGNAIKNSHITGFFRRICKLLYFGIKPVFVFDGGVPTLKRDTIKQRNEARQGKRDSAQRTARKLLALQMHNDSKKSPQKNVTSEREKSKTPNIIFRPEDDWDLPNIEGFRVSRDDARVNLNYEQEKKKKTLENILIEDTIDSLDLDSIDPTSEAFEELPKNIQYQLLSNLRLKSRLRMGYSKEQLEQVFPDSLDFSRFQIDMVKRRNYYTQRIINMTGYHDGGASKLNDEVVNRISGQRNREYKITKTDNGWTLGLGEHDGSAVSKAIELDPSIKDERKGFLDSKRSETVDMTKNEIEAEEVDEDEDEGDWEDVALEPTKVKDTFDYSLRAGRLPELDKTSQVVGSQSFLDRVPTEQSPVKRDRQAKSYKVAIPEENEISSGEESDEYARQFEEIEMMEAYQKSKLGQFQREKRIKEEREKLESKIEQKKIMEKTMKERQENIEKKKVENVISEQTEGQQNLQMILEKTNAPTISGDSFLFGESIFNSEQLESETATEGKVIPETPSWFENTKISETVSAKDVPNPFSSTMFVKDREEPVKNTDHNNGQNYELLTGRNAQHLLEEQIKLGSINEQAEKKDNVIAISDESDMEPVERSKSVDVAVQKETIESPAHGEMEVDSSTTEKPGPVAENGNNIEAALFDYEFSEDVENDLVENIRQEEKDFNAFKNKELLNEYQPDKDVISTAFLEDELYKQQVKDKRDSDEVTQDMVTDIQEMLSQFGIPFITAPMEAEAQCAELLTLKLVDGVITDDSDVFLFGGTKIYRNMFHDRKYVEFYDSGKIAVDLGLDRENMIDLALLLGSDYTNGLKGMGPVSSMEVIAEFGDLKKFKEWYEQGQFDREKLNSESKFERDLRKRMVKNDILLDETFPNELVIDAYMNPEVDHDTTPFIWGFPAVDMLRNFLEDHLGWTQEKADEILLPLIKDINNKKKNKQRAITSFFPTEYITNNNQAVSGGKRILTATSKLKKRRMK